MIPREDFAVEAEEFVQDLFNTFAINNLVDKSPILKLLRKPEFQRETNHWTPEQITTFIASFLDNEVIPSLILWKSPGFIFVIDGGHRLGALRAWVEDDYGDGKISQAFYGGEISADQKRTAKRTRSLIRSRVGEFKEISKLVGNRKAKGDRKRRATMLFTRAIHVQWIQGNPDVAETSFFKINSQGTPLDETEQMLIRNRRKPIAISARAILRSGAGHKYWSAFSRNNQKEMEKRAAEFYKILFQPEVDEPLKTLDVPLGGSVSPVDALALLIEFLGIAGTREVNGKRIEQYNDDARGATTIQVLKNSLQVISRITGNSAESLGLHPAVYVYNEKGKYSRFLFLAMSLLLQDRLRSNDDGFFKKFTSARPQLEAFLMENKSLIGIILQNLSKTQRIPKMRDLLSFVISESNAGRKVRPKTVIAHLGLKGRIIDVVAKKTDPAFSDETKSVIFIRKALKTALLCPICKGKLDPNKSVSYDHKVRVRDGGTGDADNGDLVHPYCNTGVKN